MKEIAPDTEVVLELKDGGSWKLLGSVASFEPPGVVSDETAEGRQVTCSAGATEKDLRSGGPPLALTSRTQQSGSSILRGWTSSETWRRHPMR